jgi:hypothetical protein
LCQLNLAALWVSPDVDSKESSHVFFLLHSQVHFA